jgi:hypothetical protein
MQQTHEKALRRVQRGHPCPICGRCDWCGIGDGIAICMRQASDRPTRNGGWIHRLDGRRIELPPVRPIAPMRHDLAILAEDYRTAVNPARLRWLARELGVSVESLERLGIGWAYDSGAWSFPMRDAGGRIVGIRLRLPNGRKFAVTGGREGLFVPIGLPDQLYLLLICEGPTDTAAILDLGFVVVGRPSCCGGTSHLIKLIDRLRPGQVCIVADADEPGQRGARSLASTLATHQRPVRIVTPPAGVKDARAWKQSGLSRDHLLRLIDGKPNHIIRKEVNQ